MCKMKFEQRAHTSLVFVIDLQIRSVDENKKRMQEVNRADGRNA